MIKPPAFLAPVLAAALCQPALIPSDAAHAQENVRVSYDEKEFVGKPLFVSGAQTVLLSRDGRVRRLPGLNTATIEALPDPFSGYSHSDLQHRLRREFGPAFDVSYTSHYVVVHPRGQEMLWPKRFEELFTNFMHYFSVRGMNPSEPEFRLVALVFHDRNEFLEYSRRMKEPIDERMVGYYSSRTNRIALYDSSNGGRQADRWSEDAATIYHEAAHQAAFNCGIHHRFTAPPRWVSEGLGTLFEAPGVWNGTSYATREARINRRMLDSFRREVSESGGDLDLSEILDDDNLFEADPGRAYALAWALSFYLSETQPKHYLAYLRRTADKEPFRRVAPDERNSDWSTVFMGSHHALERHVLEFFTKLD